MQQQKSQVSSSLLSDSIACDRIEKAAAARASPLLSINKCVKQQGPSHQIPLFFCLFLVDEKTAVNQSDLMTYISSTVYIAPIMDQSINFRPFILRRASIDSLEEAFFSPLFIITGPSCNVVETVLCLTFKFRMPAIQLGD